MPRTVLAVVGAAFLGISALAIARSLDHPWMHAILIGLGAGCTALALGLWWASRAPGRRAAGVDERAGAPPT